MGSILQPGFLFWDGAKYILTNAAPSAGPAGGDLTGLYPNPTIASIQGVAISGTPSAGQVLEASSSVAASWQTPAGGGGGSGPIALFAGSRLTPYVSGSLNVFETVAQFHPWPFALVAAGKTLLVAAFSEIDTEIHAIDLQDNSDNSSVLVSLITVVDTSDYQFYTATLALPLDPTKSYNLVVRSPNGDGGDHVHIQSAYIQP